MLVIVFLNCVYVYILLFRFGGGTELEGGLVVVSVLGLEVSVNLTVETHLSSVFIFMCAICEYVKL